MKHMFSDVRPFMRDPLSFLLAKSESSSERLIPLALGVNRVPARQRRGAIETYSQGSGRVDRQGEAGAKAGANRRAQFAHLERRSSSNAARAAPRGFGERNGREACP